MLKLRIVEALKGLGNTSPFDLHLSAILKCDFPKMHSLDARRGPFYGPGAGGRGPHGGIRGPHGGIRGPYGAARGRRGGYRHRDRRVARTALSGTILLRA